MQAIVSTNPTTKRGTNHADTGLGANSFLTNSMLQTLLT